MRAISVTAHGGPEVLQFRELPDPVPGPGELLVRTEAVGVNFIEVYFRMGRYPAATPFTPGTEAAGVVLAVGDGVDPDRVGDRVATVDARGSYAELFLVGADRALTVPHGVAPEVAANCLLQGMTAHYLLDGSARPQPGDDILVHAGAGGVGLLLTQLAVAKGLRVITTVSSDEKAAQSLGAGADVTLRYGDDLAARVRELTGGRGVAVAYDGVGAATFEQSLAATRVRGDVVLFGAASGPVPPFDLQRLAPLGSLRVTRPTLGAFVADPAELAWRAGEILGAVADSTLDVRVEHTYPLADAAQAHRDLEARLTTGSVALLL